MKSFKELMDCPALTVSESVPDVMIVGSITLKGVRCSVVATIADEHVSIAPYNGTTPTWDMMCRLKDVFFDSEEEAYEIHPKKSHYVNLKDNCLHLWGGVR